MQEIKAKYSMLSNTAYMLRLIWQQDKTLFLLLAIESICKVAMPFFGIYLPKLALDLIAAGATAGEAVAKLGALTAAMAVTYFLGQYADNGKYMRYNQLRMVLMTQMVFSSLGCDYAYAESAQGQAHYSYVLSHLTNGDGSAASRMIPAISGFAMGLIGFGAYSSVLAALHPMIIVLLILSSVAVYAAMQRAARYERSKQVEEGGFHQKLNYLHKAGGDAAYGKDVRLSSLRNLIVAVRERVLMEFARHRGDIGKKTFFAGGVDALITLLRDGFAYLYLIDQALSGRIAIGEFVLYIGAIAGFSAWLTTLFRQYHTIRNSHHDIGRMREYFDLETNIDPADPAAALDPSSPHSIEFENVTFAYEKGAKPVLDDFNMHIGAGEKIALVGVNGAGKSTIVKLLCGLYRADSGRILIDGVEINSMRRRDLFAMFSAIFQDIMILPYTVAENVALAPISRIDRARVEDSLRKAGLLADIARQEGGLDAHLTRMEEERGFHLSGGQQQKLLLARALYKDAPILVLDEPTAALDPIAESALYEQYHTLARDKTSIFISHRLASTRFCDRVMFVENGRAVETGTHDELMRAGGGYAKMYEIQSYYYKENLDGEAATI